MAVGAWAKIFWWYIVLILCYTTAFCSQNSHKVLKSPCDTAHAGACWALRQQLPGTLVTGKKSSFKQCCFFSILPFIGFHLHLFISAFAGNVKDFLIYWVCVCVWIVCIAAQLWCHLKTMSKMVDYQYQDTFTHIQYIPWNKHMGLLSLGLVKSVFLCINLLVFFRVASHALEQPYNCVIVYKVTLKYLDKFDFN